MKRVETSKATTSRGAEGTGPGTTPPSPEPGVTRSVVARVSVGEEEEGMATSLIKAVKMAGWKKYDKSETKHLGGKSRTENRERQNITKNVRDGG